MKSILIKLYNFSNAFYIYFFNDYLMSFPSHRFRHFLIKKRIAKLGKGNFFRMYLEFRHPKNIQIGSNNSFNQQVLLDGRGGLLKIGNYVDIAQETNIWTLEHDVHDDHHKSVGGQVIIEDYVWIASRVTILPGVTIGKGAVVASNSVVTKDVAPMTIVGGIPAKKIGERKNKLLYNPSKRAPFR